MPPPNKKTVLERAIPQPNGCITWNGARNDRGYGQLKRNNRTIYAHRASWEENRGSLPLKESYLFVLHRCDNSLCVNPEHLFIGKMPGKKR